MTHVLLTPALPADYEITDEDRAQMAGVKFEQIEGLFNQLYEQASGGNGELSIAHATVYGGPSYQDMKLMIVGSYKQNGERFCLCAGGFVVSMDKMIELMRSMFEMFNDSDEPESSS